MYGFLILAVAVLVLFGVFLIGMKKRVWSIVYESAELSEAASNQFAFLQDHGIRCRMRNQALRAGPAETSGAKVILEIHKDDLHKAKSLLENRGNGKYEFYFKLQQDI